MSKIEKILDHWKRRPSEERLDVVLSVLEHFGFKVEFKRGSHILVRHPRLVGRTEYDQSGGFSFPGKGGQRVRGLYLKDILKAINIIREEEQ